MTATAHDLEGRSARRVIVGEWHRSALLLIALIVLPFLVFGAEAIGRQVFYYHDVQYYFFPYHKLVVDFLHKGYLPLWNPYAFSGIPLLGDGQTAMFYPPNWFFLFMPPTLAINYDVLSQFSIAGAGMFLFARGLRVGRAAATLAAIAYMFNGYLATRVVHLSIMSGAALIPFVFWSADRFRVAPSSAHFASAALAVALQALAGHPQVPVYTGLALGLYLLVQELVVTAGRTRRVLRSALGVAAFYLAGYGLAAIQLFPWIDFARLSPRAANAPFDLVAYHSLTGADWLLLIMPYIFGGVREGVFSPRPPFIGTAIYIWERAAYAGVLTLALAAFAVITPIPEQDARALQRRPTRWGLIAVLLLGVLIAGGGHSAVAHLVYVTPILGKLRAYSRAIILATFAVSALAAVGLQQLIDFTEDGRVAEWMRRRLVIIAGLLTAIFVFALGILPFLIDRSSPFDHAQQLASNLSLMQPNASIPLVLAVSTIGLLLWWSRRGISRRPWPALALVAADMIVFATAFNPTTVAAELQEIPQSVTFLQRDHSLYRTATFLDRDTLDPRVARSQLALSWGMAFGIPSINGFNSLQPRRYTDILFGLGVGDVSYGFLGDNALLQRNSHVLDMLQTKYVLVQPTVAVQPDRNYRQIFKDDTVTIYLNTRAYPRAYFVSKLHLVRSQAVAYQTLVSQRFDPRSEAVVEVAHDPAFSPRLLGSSYRSEADLQQITPNHIKVAASTPADRFLVLSEMYMPGWYATIDGRPATIYRANYLFRGLIIPAGAHTVDLVYRPLSAIAGAVVSLVMAVILLGASLWGVKRGAS